MELPMNRTGIVIAALAVDAIIAIAPAQAQYGTLTRSFVSSAGVDSNPCTIAQPCATFAEAYTKISANGIIAALDPGKYGPLTIIGPVTINGNGWAALTGTGGEAIFIQAGPSDRITLTGLEIDGAGTGNVGIFFSTGYSLTVTNCALRNFTNYGIEYHSTNSTAQLFVSDTTLSGNGGNGISFGNGAIYIQASDSSMISGVLDHVMVESSGANGLSVFALNNSTGTVNMNVNDSIFANSQNDGIDINNEGTGSVGIMVRDSTIANNGGSGTSNADIGVSATGSNTVIWMTRSTVTGNPVGLYAFSNAAVYSYGDNTFVNNGSSNRASSTVGYQ
jgi:hypothetical protein